MMNNNYELKIINDYLLVTGKGIRNNIPEFVQGVDMLYDLAVNNNIYKILANYRHVFFDINSGSSDELLNQLTPVANPDKLMIAAVINEENLYLKELWIKICERKKYISAVFIDLESAEHWLYNNNEK